MGPPNNKFKIKYVLVILSMLFWSFLCLFIFTAGTMNSNRLVRVITTIKMLNGMLIIFSAM